MHAFHLLSFCGRRLKFELLNGRFKTIDASGKLVKVAEVIQNWWCFQRQAVAYLRERSLAGRRTNLKAWKHSKNNEKSRSSVSVYYE